MNDDNQPFVVELTSFNQVSIEIAKTRYLLSEVQARRLVADILRALTPRHFKVEG